ncbi:MAG: sn-glycerol-3-phosphate ABC transporter ATP-binding protein UgpC [Gemmatimonadetes bacterium]|nr:sn-glycerol-3-phosphate ABC transporter ATP-binding protein UgpC [Gemmatimonadota bacterium]
MAEVILKNIRKVYDKDVVAVDDANIEIKDKEFVVLVGPSGCGKSTTLRMIAGLEEITAGEISIDGTIVNDVPPKDRDIAMVFQNYALYPHMSVYQNMAFGLKLRKYPKDEIEARVQEAADILGIQELLERKPKALSGGQRQRVAVGRAIVRKPKVFLFDEPLSNLDAKLRVQMRTEISKLHTRLGATMVYVTHDQVEAMTMGDRIVVMRDGLIQQIDKPLHLYNKPVNQFVAGFIGSPSMNFIHGTLSSNGSGIVFDEGHVQLALPVGHGDQLGGHLGQEVTLGIRPEDIHDPDTIGRNVETVEIAAKVEVVEPMGNEVFLNLTTGKTAFVARVDPLHMPQVDQTVRLVVEIDKAHFFALDNQESLLQK